MSDLLKFWVRLQFLFYKNYQQTTKNFLYYFASLAASFADNKISHTYGPRCTTSLEFYKRFSCSGCESQSSSREGVPFIGSKSARQKSGSLVMENRSSVLNQFVSANRAYFCQTATLSSFIMSPAGVGDTPKSTVFPPKKIDSTPCGFSSPAENPTNRPHLLCTLVRRGYVQFVSITCCGVYSPIFSCQKNRELLQCCFSGSPSNKTSG